MKVVTKRPDGTVKVAIHFDPKKEPSKTQQQFQKECDINEIMRKYLKTGEITHMAPYQGKYADLSEAPDYHQAMTTVVKAQQAFDVLPAELRARFDNDPGKLLEFVHDDKNYDEAAKLGLVPEKQIPIQETPKPIETKPEVK